jgi:hypothetical protein
MSQPLSIWENAARTELMEKLYFLDGRDNPSHPHANTFTGLGVEIQIRNRVNKEKEITDKWNKLLGNQ